MTIISLEALAIIPGAKVLIYNYYFEYYICYEKRVKELLAQFNLAADYVNAKRYQLSTWPLAIAPRPWAFTIRVMLHQWRDTMENDARLRLAVGRLHGLLHSDPPALVRQQPGFSSTLIRRWRVSSSAWQDRARTVDKRLRRSVGLQLRLGKLFLTFRTWHSVTSGSAFDITSWEWKGSWTTAYPLVTILRKGMRPDDQGRMQSQFKCRLRFD